MIKNAIGGALEAPRTVTVAVNSAAVDVMTAGADMLAIVLLISATSSPVGCTAQLAGSLDNVTYIPIGSATAISANGPLSLVQDRPPFRYYRVQYAITSGSFVSTSQILAKGDKR